MTNDVDFNEKKLTQAHLDFISTVSHELRTPLTSIRGFADTLINSFDKLSPEQQMKFLHIIKDQSNRLINLVENLLAVSKIQSEQESLIFKSVNVKSVIDSCIQIVKPQYKKHSYQVDLENNLPNIFVDIDKFQQILLNLLDNASKYSEEGSLVKVKAYQNISKNTVIIKVIDEGIGISENDKDKIFNKFSRIDSPLTRKVQGSGLGLFITKNLVQNMRGSINVYNNTSSKGSTFEVEFPISNYEKSMI